MKLLLFSGTHPRHLYVNKEVLKYFDDCLVVIMEREKLIPKPPIDICNRDKQNFEKHFKNREIKEYKAFKKLNYLDVYKGKKQICVTPDKLNSLKLAAQVEKFDADICFIFGTNLILSPVIDFLPKNKINLHLGLSPWYKGAATLFWPFYFLEPQFAGITFHQITKKADQGKIIHQSVPNLEYGDTIHDVGVKCIINAKKEIKKLINHFKKNKSFDGKIQFSSGRLWRVKDFHPSQLRVIYNLFNDDIVDKYLDGKLNKEKPKIYSCLQ